MSSIAWIITLLTSSLVDILFYELAGMRPSWLLWGKAGLLGAFILLTWFWKRILPLRPYFIMLLALALLTRANIWLLNTPAWLAWQEEQSFTVVFTIAQLIEMGVALILIVILFLMGRRRQDSFLIKGDVKAQAEPVRWLGQKSPGSLWKFGLVFTLVVIAGEFFMFILPLSPSPNMLLKLAPYIPFILLLAISNGFNEEIIFRVSPMSTSYEVVGKANAIWMAAITFGLAHYIGGAPAGIPGFLITALLGWFFGKCMLDSKGFFWPWLFHALQDVLPFSMMVLNALP